MNKFIYLFILILFFKATVIFGISDDFKKILKSRSNFRYMPSRGLVSRLIPVDFNSDGKNEYVCVEKGLKRFSVFDCTGNKKWELANGFFIDVIHYNKNKDEYLILITKPGSHYKQEFLLYKPTGILHKKIELKGKLDYSYKKDKFLYKSYIMDVNYDSIPEIVFVSNYGEQLYIFDLDGNRVLKKNSLIYFPKALAEYNKYKNNFLPCYDFFNTHGKFYFDKDNIENSDFIELDSKEQKAWLKVHYIDKNNTRIFNITSLSRPDVINNPFYYSFSLSNFKGKKCIFLGARNTVFIIDKRFNLVKIIENVFY